MEINKGNLNVLDIQSTGESSNMKLDENSQAMIFQMFTGGLYSDPIGTVVREIASNCFDSHVEAGVDSTKNPVIIELKREVSGNFIIFSDKGVGMSPDRVYNIYGTYFKSTKDKSNDQIGGFGLGGKTPLAYTESFYIITRFDGIEYVYNVYEANQTPAIELMSQTSTDQHNGTDVKIPVKEYDIEEFEKKTLRQLYYFENIIFKGFSDQYVTNDYSIVKGKNFLYRGNNYQMLTHACFGKVAYPIDFEAIGLNPSDYRIPIAIRIEIGELEGTGVTPSRESLKYGTKNVQIIKKKLELAYAELTKMLVKQYNNVVTLTDYYAAMENFGTLIFSETQAISLNGIVSKKDVNLEKFTFADFKIPDSNSIIDTFFKIKLYGKKYPKRYSNEKEWHGQLDRMSNYNNIYYVKDEFKRVVLKQSYLYTLSKYKNFHIVTPRNFNGEQDMNRILRELGVIQDVLSEKIDVPNTIKYSIPRKKAEKLVHKLFNEVFDIVQGKATGDYDKVVVPENFKIARKKNRITPEMGKAVISVRSAEYSGRYNVKFSSFEKLSGRIYYGFSEDEHLLDRASYIFRSICTDKKCISPWDIAERYNRKDNVHGSIFIIISKANEKYMNALGRKAIHVKYFYQTFISRKLDMIINEKINILNQSKFENDVYHLFHTPNFKYIDQEVYSLAVNLKSKIKESRRDVVNSVSVEKIKNMFNVDLEDIKPSVKDDQDLNELIRLSQLNENKLKWFSFPYEIDPNKKDHQEFIDMVNLMFEK